MSDDKKFDYKEKLINDIPEEFRDKEKVPFDRENVTIRELLDMSGFVKNALKMLPEAHHKVYLSFVDSLVEKNQKHLEQIREKFKDPKITKEILRNIVAKKRS